MTRVLLALAACVAILVAVIAASRALGTTGLASATEQFLTRYTSDQSMPDLLEVANPAAISSTEPDQAAWRRAFVRDRMGRFVRIERVLIDRTYPLPSMDKKRGGDFEVVAAFEKGNALTRLRLVEGPDRWMVDHIEVDIPLALRKMTAEQMAEMVSVAVVRYFAEGAYDLMREMGTEELHIAFPPEVLQRVVEPLQQERGALKHVGVVLSEARPDNQRSVRALGEYERGSPLAFDMTLAWARNRWLVADLRVKPAPGETIPEDKRRPAVLEDQHRGDR